MDQKVGFCTTPDGVRICYATVGHGTPLVKAANWLSHLQFDWHSPVWRHWLEELSKDHLLIRYDERGCGLSDWSAEDISFGAFVADLETVVDTLGLDRFALLGISQGGSVAVEYSVRHPERVSHLVLYGAYARGWARRGQASLEEREALLTLTRQGWGRDNPAYRQVFTSLLIPEAIAEQQSWFNELQRISTSAENAVRLQIEFGKIDVLDRLPQVSVPTLVLHSRFDGMVPFEEGRQIAALIPNSRFGPLESRNHNLLESDPAWPMFLSNVRQFLSTVGEPPSSSEGLAAAVGLDRPDLRSRAAPDGTITVLFSDIEGSTTMTERLGDQKMQDILQTHNGIFRQQLVAFGGFEVKSLGDGFMLAFSSARRAVQCAGAIQRAFVSYNNAHPEESLRVRIGLHTGEAIKDADDFYGKSVILASRIANQARGGEILVSSLLKELTESAGDIRFGEVQEVELKGLAGRHRLYPVEWE